MNTQPRLKQRIGGLGIVYSVLFVVAMFVTGNGKAASATGPAVIKYYRSHRAAEIAAVFVIAIAAIVFTFFLSSLRRALSETPHGRQFAPVVTAGGAVYVVGLILQGVLTLALVDTAHYHLASAAQTINVLDSDDWLPVVAGLSMVGLGTGVAALRSAALPRWLAWASIVLGVLAVAGPLGELAFVIAPLWTLAIGIVMLRSTPDRPTQTSPNTEDVTFTRSSPLSRKSMPRRHRPLLARPIHTWRKGGV